MIISQEERVSDALGCRLGEFCFEHDRVGQQIDDLTKTLSKLNTDYAEKRSELIVIKNCIDKLDKGNLEDGELDISIKIYSEQAMTVQRAIEYLELYIDSTTRKIEELKIVYEDLALDIDAIDDYLGKLRKTSMP